MLKPQSRPPTISRLTVRESCLHYDRFGPGAIVMFVASTCSLRALTLL